MLGFRILGFELQIIFLAGFGLGFQFKWVFFAGQIELVMFGVRNLGFEFSSCGFGIRFFNINVLF
jgi:hypothetical protein